jgi:hypothetical protein
MDQSGVISNRRSRRSPVLLAASIEIDGGDVTVKLRNLSEEGALIEGERLPIEGSVTTFRRNDLKLQSRIVWVHGRFAGVAFDQRLKPEQVLRNIPAPRRKVQTIDHKRPGLSSRPLTDYERQMLESWLALPPSAVGTN